MNQKKNKPQLDKSKKFKFSQKKSKNDTDNQGKLNNKYGKTSDRPQNPRRAFKKEAEKPENSRMSPRVSSTGSIRKTHEPAAKSRGDRVVKEFKREKELFIWGKRTVESYLANLHSQENVAVEKYKVHIIVDKSNKAPAQLKPIVESAKALGISVMSHTSAEDTWPLAGSDDLNHQRVCLRVPEYPVSYLEDVLALMKAKVEDSEYGCIGLVLDQIQDPRNFGAILRSAAFFGVKFVVYATDRQSDITGLVLKTSAGGAFSLMLVPVVNINRALAQLKESGAWIIGTSLQENSIECKQLPKDRQWVLVLGNEEKGLRTEVVKNCDYLVKIPGNSQSVDSLNVSVAAGVFIHALQP